MGKEVLVIVLLGTMTPLAAGLWCHVCNGTLTESEDYDTPFSPADPSCVLGNLTDSMLQECFPIPGSREAKCVKTMGVTKVTVAGTTISVTTTTRSCDVTGSVEQGCKTQHQKVPVSARSLIDETSTEWTICSCYTDQCNGQAPVSPAIVTCISSLVMVMLAIW